MLRPNEFGTIFLCMGPFHWTEIVNAAIGNFLRPSGISDALVNSNVFGKSVVESQVIKGGDYIKSKEGLTIIAEAMIMLQYEEFTQTGEFIGIKQELQDEHNFGNNLKELLETLFSEIAEESNFSSAWNKNKGLFANLKDRFDEFCTLSEGANKNFCYWNIFLKDIFPIMSNFELSVRRGDWGLFFNSVKRCLPLFFGTGRTHYSRWAPIFYEDCLQYINILKMEILFVSFPIDNAMVLGLIRHLRKSITSHKNRQGASSDLPGKRKRLHYGAC